jgi:glycosyltransferase involved in cell wall biosynthesis
MPKKILFLSSTNLTSNPRLQKELKFALEQGHSVHFVGFDLDNWSQKTDAEIIKTLNADFTYIPVTRKNIKNWLIPSLIEKAARTLSPFFSNKLALNAFAHSKRSYLLSKFLKKHKQKYDLIAAHTLPTLFPAYQLARKQNIPFIFDIEDYHPGEAVSDKHEVARREFLMKKLLPKADFLTYASPLIGKESLKLLNNYPDSQHGLINNCFAQSEFQFKENQSEKLKFVWFSQNIAAGRGLELVIPALFRFKDKIELHLIGHLYQNFYEEYLAQYSEILNIHKPLPQKELNLKLAEFDVGLAIELNTADFNRQICLTNKIWAYFQSGLYILATDTPAQKQFLEQKNKIGLISRQNISSFEVKIETIIKSIKTIRQGKEQSFRYARKFAWENEKKKLASIWKN